MIWRIEMIEKKNSEKNENEYQMSDKLSQILHTFYMQQRQQQQQNVCTAIRSMDREHFA